MNESSNVEPRIVMPKYTAPGIVPPAVWIAWPTHIKCEEELTKVNPMPEITLTIEGFINAKVLKSCLSPEDYEKVQQIMQEAINANK